MKLFTFIHEVRTELTKVTWPTRAETIRLTLIVVAISVITGLYLGGLDLLFTQMLKFLVS
ncbi:MAG: preprotein translocase subunit SecE [Candidatus Levybacteria bacterium]|nr:preprotein translocase subunit SecE [Candidatus Levybacteria bacterium]